MTAHGDMLTQGKIATWPAQRGLDQFFILCAMVDFSFIDLEVIEELSVFSGEEGDCLSRFASSTSSTNPATQSSQP